MGKRVGSGFEYRTVELDGVRYAILREAALEALLRKAGVAPAAADHGVTPPEDFDRATLAEKLAGRRRATGLSQAELARRAGIRPETLNRIERGRTNPDFATVRKLVLAMDAAEKATAEARLSRKRKRSPSR